MAFVIGGLICKLVPPHEQLLGILTVPLGIGVFGYLLAIMAATRTRVTDDTVEVGSRIAPRQFRRRAIRAAHSFRRSEVKISAWPTVTDEVLIDGIDGVVEIRYSDNRGVERLIYVSSRTPDLVVDAILREPRREGAVAFLRLIFIDHDSLDGLLRHIDAWGTRGRAKLPRVLF